MTSRSPVGAQRYDVKAEDDKLISEAREWLEVITGSSLGDDFGLGLKDGMILCQLINVIHPGIVRKIESSKMPFKQMENVSNFLKACRVVGVNEYELFETVDLFELKDLGLVVRCIFALGRAVQKNYPDFQGPALGVKESKPNPRHFSQQQLDSGKHAVSQLTLGSSKTMDRTIITDDVSITFGAVAGERASEQGAVSPVVKAAAIDATMETIVILNRQDSVNSLTDSVDLAVEKQELGEPNPSPTRKDSMNSLASSVDLEAENTSSNNNEASSPTAMIPVPVALQDSQASKVNTFVPPAIDTAAPVLKTFSRPSSRECAKQSPIQIKTRGGGYGLDADLAKRAMERYDSDAEEEAQVWIEQILQKEFPTNFADSLKDGVLLCQLMNALQPQSIPKIQHSKMPFKQMENISMFLRQCRVLGVLEFDLFETVDLYEQKDLGVVVRCLHSLGRAVQKNLPNFDGPKLGVKNSKPKDSHIQDSQASKVNTFVPPAIDTAAPVLKTFSRPSSRECAKQSPIQIKTRGGGYGLDADLAKRAMERYDSDAEEEAQVWIEQILQKEFPTNFADSLKDGVLLCQLMNALQPQSIPKIQHSKMPFKQMENISMFLRQCRVLGVLEFDLFETVDLYEQKDLGVVVRCLHSLGRAVQKNLPNFDGPKLGVKESTANEREFSHEQVLEAKKAVSKWSMGSSSTMPRSEIRNDASVTYGVIVESKLVDSSTIPSN